MSTTTITATTISNTITNPATQTAVPVAPVKVKPPVPPSPENICEKHRDGFWKKFSVEQKFSSSVPPPPPPLPSVPEPIL